MRDALEYTTYKSDHPDWYRLYECEHITDGTYPAENAIPVGEHTNLILCKHCWTHVFGMVAADILKNAVRQKSMEEIHEMLTAPREKV